MLEKWGYTVIKQDKYPKTDDTIEADFLTDDIPECDMIIFNPPFCLKTEFLQRACESGKPFIFICPVTIIETQKRFALFREHNLNVLNLPNRTNYMSKTGNKVWFHSVWVLKHPEYTDTHIRPYTTHTHTSQRGKREAVSVSMSVSCVCARGRQGPYQGQARPRSRTQRSVPRVPARGAAAYPGPDRARGLRIPVVWVI